MCPNYGSGPSFPTTRVLVMSLPKTVINVPGCMPPFVMNFSGERYVQSRRNSGLTDLPKSSVNTMPRNGNVYYWRTSSHARSCWPWEGSSLQTASRLPLISPEEVSSWVQQVPYHDGYWQVIRQVEARMVKAALGEAQGNKTESARILGIHRRLLYEKLSELGLN